MICGTYYPSSQNDDNYFYEFGKPIDIYSSIYDKFILIGDFSAEESESCLTQFAHEHNANNSVSKKSASKVKINLAVLTLLFPTHQVAFKIQWLQQQAYQIARNW